MRGKTRVRQIFLAASASIVLAILFYWKGATEIPAGLSAGAEERQSALLAVTPQRQHHEATLTDASQLYRVCSSRPQRITHSQSSRTGRTVTPFGSLPWRHIVSHTAFSHDNRCRQETAPFCSPASRLYYVIALRHIIR